MQLSGKTTDRGLGIGTRMSLNSDLPRSEVCPSEVWGGEVRCVPSTDSLSEGAFDHLLFLVHAGLGGGGSA